MDKTEEIIEDCPDFMYGCCQKYLDGDCSAHKCDLKIIRELQQELQAKEQECEELKFTIKHTGLLDLMNKNVQLRKALDEIEKYLDAQQQYFDGEDYHNLLNIINKAKEQ